MVTSDMTNSLRSVYLDEISMGNCSNGMDGTVDDGFLERSDNNSSGQINTNRDINEMSDSNESEDELNVASTSYVNNK